MKLYQIIGQGSFTSSDGSIVKYEVNKLLLQTQRGSIEIKIDKLNKRLLPFLFEQVPTDQMVEDTNGVQCTLFELEPLDNVNVNVE